VAFVAGDAFAAAGAFGFALRAGGSTSSRLRSWSWLTKSQILRALSNIGW